MREGGGGGAEGDTGDRGLRVVESMTAVAAGEKGGGERKKGRMGGGQWLMWQHKHYLHSYTH